MSDTASRPARPRRPAGHSPIDRLSLLTATLVLTAGVALGGCADPTGPGVPGAPPPADAAPSRLPTLAPPASATPTSAPPASGAAPPTGTTTPATPTPPPEPQSLRLDAEGPAVTEIQHRLSDLGYWLGTDDGHYGQLTRQAVMAFQKAEGLSRDGVAGPRTRDALPAAVRPRPAHTDGDLIEIDLDRQLLFVVQDGALRWTFNTSTGNGEGYDRPSGGNGVATTPHGTFEIQRQIDGVREAELGDLYRPKYFRGGIAVHGAGSVPARPASHGCVRVTNAAMDLLWSSGVAEIGTTVVVE